MSTDYDYVREEQRREEQRREQAREEQRREEQRRREQRREDLRREDHLREDEETERRKAEEKQKMLHEYIRKGDMHGALRVLGLHLERHRANPDLSEVAKPAPAAPAVDVPTPPKPGRTPAPEETPEAAAAAPEATVKPGWPLGNMAVIVNDVRIAPGDQARISRDYGLNLPPGRYWYDRLSGAWGFDGTPTQGFTRAGMDIGGPLPEDASVKRGGWLDWLPRARTYVNGREIPVSEGLWLHQVVQQTGVMLWAGALLARCSGQSRQGRRGHPGQSASTSCRDPDPRPPAGDAWGGGGGSGPGYLRRTTSGYLGGDGQTSYFFDPETGASAMT